MKTQSFARFILAVFGLLSMSSCTVYVDDAGGIVGTGFQPVRAGFGFLPQSPLVGGSTVLHAGAVGGLCSPGGPFIRGGFATRPLPPQWGNVYPYGSQCSPGYPGNYYSRYPISIPPPCPRTFGPGYGGMPARWY